MRQTMVSAFALLQDAARAAPDAPSVIAAGTRLSRAEVLSRVAALAQWMQAEGLPQGGIVGVTVTDEVEHVLVSLALMSLGTASLPLASHEPDGTRAAMAARLGIGHVVLGQDASAPDTVTALRPPLSATVPLATAEMVMRLRATEVPVQSALVYRSTSGTTGIPKTFGQNMIVLLDNIARIQASPNEACVLRCSSVEYDSSRIYRLVSLLAGCTAAFLDPVTAETLGPFCAAAGVTEIHCGTYKLASLLSGPPHPEERLPPGTRIATGGSRVPGALRAEVQRRLTQELWISLATSETAMISMATPQEHALWPEGVGHPIPGVEVDLRGPEGAPVPPGEIGTAWIRKAGVNLDTDGRPDWFCTGDLLSWPKGAPLIFHGRADDMMILNGINVFPSAIEDTLEAHPDVREAAAYAIASQVHGQIPVAAVTLRAGAVADIASLMAYARAELGVRAPRRITVLQTMPRTALGKVKRKALAAQDQGL